MNRFLVYTTQYIRFFFIYSCEWDVPWMVRRMIRFLTKIRFTKVKHWHNHLPLYDCAITKICKQLIFYWLHFSVFNCYSFERNWLLDQLFYNIQKNFIELSLSLSPIYIIYIYPFLPHSFFLLFILNSKVSTIWNEFMFCFIFSIFS